MIRVVVQDETGQEMSEPIDVPTEVLARPGDARFTCLRFVDPYGDTVFNRLQLPHLVEDLRLLTESCSEARHQGVIRQVEKLIERCQDNPHLYLKLIGD